MAKLAIKSDNRKQNLLLPPSLDELVPENHMVRVVDAVIDRLDISDILSTYRGGGNSAFNPKNDAQGADFRISEQCILLASHRGTSQEGYLFYVACRHEASRLPALSIIIVANG